jgi:hypothetical protein
MICLTIWSALPAAANLRRAEAHRHEHSQLAAASGSSHRDWRDPTYDHGRLKIKQSRSGRLFPVIRGFSPEDAVELVRLAGRPPRPRIRQLGPPKNRALYHLPGIAGPGAGGLPKLPVEIRASSWRLSWAVVSPESAAFSAIALWKWCIALAW